MILEYAEDSPKIMTATEQESIENSISTIASTPYASAPFIRSMGIKNYPLESASEVARNQYATEVITQCGVWENRAKVSALYFGKNDDVRMVISNG